jgi:multiple sugar transport system substrate-binding protein
MSKEDKGASRRGYRRSSTNISTFLRSALVAVSTAGTLALTGGATQGAEITFFMGPYSASTPASMETMVANFQAANPGTTVSYQSAPWDSYDEKISTAAKAGDGPGLAMEYTFGKFIADGLVRPTADWVSPELLADFIPAFLEPGQGYAVPDLASVRGTFHNVALLKAAGVDGLPETFVGLDAALVAIQQSNPAITPLGFVSTPDDIAPSYSYYLFGAGGAWIDDSGKFLMNSVESVAAMTYLKDLYDRKLLEQDVTADRGAQEGRFQAGQTAIFPTGNFFVTTLEKNVPDLEYAVGALPHLDNVEPFAVGVSDYFIAFEQGEEARNKAGADLNAFIFDPVNYVPWLAADGFLPVTRSSFEPYRAAAPEMAPFLDNLESAKFYPSGDVRWGQVVTIMSETVQGILLGRTPVQAGLDAAQAQIDALPTS